MGKIPWGRILEWLFFAIGVGIMMYSVLLYYKFI